jgi:hypothetical protein
MKVKCIQLRSQNGQTQDSSSWLTIGCIYHVLTIEIERGKTLLRLVGDEPTPALFEVEMFEVVSSILPSTWRVVSSVPGRLTLAPAKWTRSGFWEDFFNGTAAAIACFRQEQLAIIDSDP